MRKYLIVGPSWVGDMVMAQSLFKLLKKRYPDSIIDVVAPGWSEPILSRMPEVRRTITLPMGHGDLQVGERWKLGASLRSEKYTHAITVPRSWKSAIIPFAANIPSRTGFHGEQRYILLNDRRKLDKKILNQTVKRFVYLGLEKHEQLLDEHIENPALTVYENHFTSLVEQFGLDPAKPAISLMPGAEYGPAKQWPLEYFRELATILVKRGFQVWVIGGPKDSDAGSLISNALDSVYNLCGRTQLSEAVDLLALSEQAVSNDSGLMHVAAATGTKVHGIYGSSSPNFTPPLTDNKVIHYLGLDCSPCFKRTCPLNHLNCLNKITASELVI